LETSVISYVASRPSRDLIVAAHQQLTHAWMDDLLTWNCRHLASARTRRIVQQVNTELGLATPVICTPEELMEL